MPVKAILEQIHPEEIHSFYVRRYRSKRFTCPYHYHPEAELTLIVRGEGQRLVGDHLDRFKAGDIVLMGPNLPHTYFHTPGSRPDPRGVESIVIQFKPEMAGGVLSSPECREFAPLMIRAARGVAVLGSNRAELVRVMESLVEAQSWRRWTLLMEALALISKMRKSKVLASELFEPRWNQRQSKRIERVCAWIAAHYREPITLLEAARQAHLSPPAFSRFFRRATNRTFTRFVNELRIAFACRQLLETDQGISPIAFDSGFENLSNFNRRFQELRSTTPKAYRMATTRGKSVTD